MSKYIYGPLNSRRLGVSLGVSLTPYKICDFDCIYCQLGSTKAPTSERQEYAEASAIINELKDWLTNNPKEAVGLSYITISGSGEPTLNIKIGELIREIKKITTLPIAVITNSSLLNDPAVRAGLLESDLLIPSLDSVVPEIFNKIDRPQADINIEAIINGLICLRREFKGKIWLEVMIVKGLNDKLSQARKLKEVVDKIDPDKIQINLPVRSTTEENILPADKKRLEQIKEILGDKCEII